MADKLSSPMRKDRRPWATIARRITVLYIAVGSLWILLSDRLILLLTDDPDMLTSLQMYKGWFYVAVTGILLYYLIKRDLVRIEAYERRQREVESARLEFYRRTIAAATDGKLVVTGEEEIEKLKGEIIDRWELNGLQEVPLVRSQVADRAGAAGMEEDKIDDFMLCVGEMLTNACKHAGGGVATMYRVADGLLLKVTDRGPGIEALALPDVALRRGYSTASSLGMGYKLIIALADRVFLATGPGGTTVAVEMKLHR